MKTKQLTFIAVLITFALILSYIETFIPVIAIPGAKLGLANVATLMALYLFDFKSAFFVVFLRTSLAAFMFTNLTTLIYSLSGGLVSLLVMYLLLRIWKNHFSIIGISIAGAVFHNLAQVAVAVFVLGTTGVLSLIPYLIAIAILTGTAIGISAKYLLKYTARLHLNSTK